MNLHSIVARSVGAVNPLVPCSVQQSTGYTTQPNGARVPAYAPARGGVLAQVQALTTKNLHQLDSLNIAGSTHTIYLSGDLEAVQRIKNIGGDLITLANGGLFLVTAVLERWPDWVCCSVTLQLK